MNRRTRLQMVVAASMLVALSACSTDSTPPALDDNGVNTATTTAVDAPDVCAGSTDCVVLAETDIDGDSLADTVRRTGDVLEVLTETGARANTSATPADRLQNPDLQIAGGFVGAFDVNGRPGHEIVVADELLDGSGRYQVFTWQRGNLAVISTPSPLYSGNPVHWALSSGDSYGSAVRCTDHPDRPIEVWMARPSSGGGGISQMTVQAFTYDPEAVGGAEGPPFFEAGTYVAEYPDQGTLDRFPWLCGDNVVESAPEAVEQCGTASQDTAISDGLAQLPANPAPGARWAFVGQTNFDPCADLSYALAETSGGTGSSPMHVMLFHRGEYTGTGTLCALGRTTVVDATGDQVNVVYRYPQGTESNAAASGLAQVSYTWSGDGVTMLGDLPDELLEVNGC